MGFVVLEITPLNGFLPSSLGMTGFRFVLFFAGVSF